MKRTLKFTVASAEYTQEVSEKVETIDQVGATAGQVWHILKEHGPQTVVQLKKRLNGSADLLGFALGWLAREDKIDISLEKKNFKATLKS